MGWIHEKCRLNILCHVPFNPFQTRCTVSYLQSKKIYFKIFYSQISLILFRNAKYQYEVDTVPNRCIERTKSDNQIIVMLQGVSQLYAEGSLIVTDFTISHQGSSCNYIFFSLILAILLSVSIYSICLPQSEWESKKQTTIEEKREIRPKNERVS